MTPVYKITPNTNLKNSLEELLKPLGGLKKFIEKGDVVFLKPNFNTADPFPASSNIDILKALTEMLYEVGAKMVAIGDSSTVSLNTRKVMEKKGAFKLLEMETPPRIYVFEEGNWVKVNIPNGKYLKTVSLPEIFLKADKVILVPCLKTHKNAGFTGALKLSVGLVKPLERIPMHLKNLSEKIADLNKVIKCDLVIMDARKCFITKGPSSGEVKEPNLLMASTSRVAIDIEGVNIIKTYKGNDLSKISSPQDLSQIKLSLNLE